MYSANKFSLFGYISHAYSCASSAHNDENTLGTVICAPFSFCAAHVHLMQAIKCKNVFVTCTQKNRAKKRYRSELCSFLPTFFARMHLKTTMVMHKNVDKDQGCAVFSPFFCMEARGGCIIPFHEAPHTCNAISYDSC